MAGRLTWAAPQGQVAHGEAASAEADSEAADLAEAAEEEAEGAEDSSENPKHQILYLEFYKKEVLMKAFLITLAVVVVIGALGLAGVYNNIVSLHETITAKWAQVENQIQRRADLIPNLVNTVKGYAAHEKTLFEDVTRARSQWASAKSVDEKVAAAGTIDSALSRLIAVAENYPLLKADQTFLRLMDELSGTENRVAVERMRYNESVQNFNITVRRFPGNVVAGFFGYKPATEYFKAEQRARAVPEVKF